MPNLLIIAAVLLGIFLLFKIFGWSIKIFIKLLINAVIGGVILVVVNLVGGLIGITLPINWITCLITGIFGVPGVIVLIIGSLVGCV